MATAGKDIQSKELNALFRSLGELDEEGKQWREQNHTISEMIQFFNALWFPTTFRLYGSEAEDLKCYFPDDVGDVDIMIFQDLDNCIIDEEMLEYSPERPLHVKIKGADHPLLKSCLVEDTEYVATSALKNFDPPIFSGLPILTLGKGISALLHPQFHRIFMTDDITSPAVAMNFASSFGSFAEILEAYKGSIDPLPNFDPASFELFSIITCRFLEIDYTRELADRLNDFWQFFKNSFISLIYNTSTDTVFHDMIGLTVDLWMQFMTILVEINGESNQDESRPKRDLALPRPNSNEDPCVAQEKFGRNASEGERVERNNEIMPVYNHILQSDDSEIASASSTAVEDPLEDRYHPSGQEGKLDQASDGSEENSTTSQKDSQNISNELNTNEDDNRQPIKNSTLLELCFGPATEMQEEPSKQKKFRDMEEAKPYVRVGGIDFVPAFKARGWPNVAKEWIKRKRKWPSPKVVRKVIQEGYHFVVKPPKNNGNPECDFRISFSHAEYLLSQEMNDIQRECYRCLKKCHRTHFSTQPISLVTFHLKTILMHTIEETDPEMWTENNRAECMMKLLLNLMEALRKKHLPHFFVESYNLFSPDCVENADLLETLVDKVEQFLKRPEELVNKLIKDHKDAKQSRKGWRQACQGNLIGSELTVSAKESAQQLEKMEATQSKSNSDIQAQHDELQGKTNSTPSYYDLKDIYVDICRELTTLALSDNGVEGLGNLERKVVESLRECAEKYEIDEEQTFSRLFKIGWNKIYISIWLNKEGLDIERMLARIQSLVELWRENNEEADSTPDPFDPEALLTSGVVKTLLTRLIRSIEPGRPQLTQSFQ